MSFCSLKGDSDCRQQTPITNQSILLFALDITEKGVGWSHQKRPHAPPDIANYLMLSVVTG